MKVPSLRQIQQSFRQDVQLPSWRTQGKAPGPVVFHGPQKDLFDLLMKMARQAARDRRQVLGELKTPRQVMQRAAKARQVCREVMGLATLPPRTPLEPKLTPGVQGPGYRIEHVVLQSRPGCFVTGNVYVPTQAQGPFPAILHVCGHSLDGKHYYHRTTAILASAGFLVFSIDPPGQGERDEYVDIATGQRTIPRACRMHAVAGDPIYLTGQNLGGYRLWDCMRSLDYLQSRPDVIASSLGTTGTSGGGWESLWLAAVDGRIKAVSANCYFTTFLRRMEERHRDAEPDPEQDPFGLLSAGLDAADLALACLPAAVCIGSTTQDFFPIDGAKAAFRDARRLFQKAGFGERIAMVVDEAPHQFTAKMRQQMIRWMTRWLMGKAQPAETPATLPLVSEKENLCTPTGIVLISLGGKTTAQFNAERSRDLAIARRKRLDALAAPARQRFIARKLRDLLHLADPAAAVRVRKAKTVPVGRDGIRRTDVQILSGDGQWLSAHLWEPAAARPCRASILLQPKNATYRPEKNTVCPDLARAGNVVLDLDVRGLGAVDDVYMDFIPLLDSNLAYDAFLLGKTLLGLRVADVLRAVDFLQGRKNVQPGGISVTGYGPLALPALFAAAVDKRLEGATEVFGLTSYGSLTWNRDYGWPVSVILPGILESMDLEDIRAALAPRLLCVISPRNHHLQQLDAAQAVQEFALVEKAYLAAHAPEHFSLGLLEGELETGMLTAVSRR